MPGAEGAEVGGGGFAAVVPGGGVIDLAQVGPSVAAGEPAGSGSLLFETPSARESMMSQPPCDFS